MPKVAIVTDSTSSLPPHLAEEHGIHVMPIYVTFACAGAAGTGGRQTFRDGVDLDAEQFYRRLRESKELPTTAQPSVMDFVQAYTELARQAEAIVSIHLCHAMSATLDSALAAARELPQVPIHVIDSRSVSMGLGLMALEAARVAAAGRGAAEVIGTVKDLIPRMKLIFTVNSLEYLHKGGRIGGAAALLGLALRIKPILCVKDGQVEALERTRTRRRAKERLLEIMEAWAGSAPAAHVAVLHAAVPEEARVLADQVTSRFHCGELHITEAGPIIGTHAGPGTLGLAFYSEGAGVWGSPWRKEWCSIVWCAFAAESCCLSLLTGG